MNIWSVEIIQSIVSSFSLPPDSGGGGHTNMCYVERIQSIVNSFSLPASSGGHRSLARVGYAIQPLSCA